MTRWIDKLNAGFKGRRWCALIGVSLAVLAPCRPAVAQIPCQYEISAIIQAPPCGDQAQHTTGTAISPNGRWVVGWYCQCLCINFESFVYDALNGTFATIPRPAGVFTSQAADVNDAGIVVGSIDDDGYVYNAVAGQYLAILESDSPGGVCSAAGINNDNVVCGTRSINDGGNPVEPKTAFKWSAAGGFNDLGLFDGQSTFARDLNSSAMTTGTLAVSQVTQPFIWSHRGAIPQGTLSGHSTGGNAISNCGVVVGFAATSGNIFSPNYRGFVDHGSWLESIGVLAGFNYSTAFDVNSSSFVVGECGIIGKSDKKAVLWAAGQLIDLRQRMDFTQFWAESAISISDNGQICVNGASQTSFGVAVLTPIPPRSGDTNCDAVVNVTDLLAVIGSWGQTAAASDLNLDRIVNVQDLILVILNWGSG